MSWWNVSCDIELSGINIYSLKASNNKHIPKLNYLVKIYFFKFQWHFICFETIHLYGPLRLTFYLMLFSKLFQPRYHI